MSAKCFSEQLKIVAVRRGTEHAYTVTDVYQRLG